MGYLKETIGYSFYHCIDKKLFVLKHDIFPEKEFVLERSSERKKNLKMFRNHKLTLKWNSSPRLQL